MKVRTDFVRFAGGNGMTMRTACFEKRSTLSRVAWKHELVNVIDSDSGVLESRRHRKRKGTLPAEKGIVYVE